MKTPNPHTYYVTRYGQTFPLTVDDRIMEAHYAKNELCEFHMLDWIEANVKRGGVWIDAGANVGNHALPFSLWADRVVCFEPMPVNFTLLERNIAQFGATNIMAHRLGVGTGPEWVTAEVGGTGENCQWELRSGGAAGDIQVVALDAIIPGVDVRVLKLDVEGMEVMALNGARRIISTCRPEIFVEIWDEAVLERITTELSLYGYELVERWNVAPTFHFSQRGRYPVTYKPAERLRP